MTREEKILQFREAYRNLEEDDKLREASRVFRIASDEPVLVLEDHETARVLKFLDLPNLIEYLWQEKQIRADRSFLYKVLKGQYSEAYGYKMYYDYEEE